MSSSPPELPTPATALVDYRAGSVVSRALIKSKGGTVTLFAFDAGEALSEHTAPFDALLLILEGRAQVRVGGDEHVVPGGSTILLPANVPHAVRAPERFKMLLVMIREVSQGTA